MNTTPSTPAFNQIERRFFIDIFIKIEYNFIRYLNKKVEKETEMWTFFFIFAVLAMIPVFLTIIARAVSQSKTRQKQSGSGDGKKEWLKVKLEAVPVEWVVTATGFLAVIVILSFGFTGNLGGVPWILQNHITAVLILAVCIIVAGLLSKYRKSGLCAVVIIATIVSLVGYLYNQPQVREFFKQTQARANEIRKTPKTHAEFHSKLYVIKPGDGPQVIPIKSMSYAYVEVMPKGVEYQSRPGWKDEWVTNLGGVAGPTIRNTHAVHVKALEKEIRVRVLYNRHRPFPISN